MHEDILSSCTDCVSSGGDASNRQAGSPHWLSCWSSWSASPSSLAGGCAGAGSVGGVVVHGTAQVSEGCGRGATCPGGSGGNASSPVSSSATGGWCRRPVVGEKNFFSLR